MESVFWSDGVAGLHPYVPGEQPQIANLVKLNTNENPFPPSAQVLAAITTAAQSGLQRYPDPQSSELVHTLAVYHGLDVSQVFVGNGSDEVLAHAFRALYVKQKPLLMPDISYSFYGVYAALFGIPCQAVPLNSDLVVDVNDYLAIDPSSVAGVVIANPNAPTGVAISLADIERVLQHFAQVAVLIDEAYVDFGAASACKLIDQYPNLLVVQTLSKSRSLAGLRIGFALGSSELIDGLVRVKDSFNSYPLDKIAQAAAVAAFADQAYFEQCRDAVVSERAVVTDALTARGFNVLPSTTNFVFASHPDYQGRDLLAALRERAVLVRQFEKPRIADFLRISIGTVAQNQALIAALDDILA